MIGPKHYEIAEQILLAVADDMAAGHITTEQDVAKAHLVVAQANAHATLAMAASNLSLGGLNDDDREWARVLGGAE